MKNIARKKRSRSSKDRKKLIRSILQAGFLLTLLFFLLKALLTTVEYQPYAPVDYEAPDKGFIAVSYFGVDRNGTKSLISTKQLEQHLKALKDSGYVTITQQDILDYYYDVKPLPEKALFLMFEDGRRDTAIFAQKIMEKYNTMATMSSYADKFAQKDPKFLSPKDLLDLVDSSFWELGTNGYRLSFINVFDRYDYYLGELSPLEFSMVSPYLNRKYDHYLMDYIRDAYGVPKEGSDEMKARIDEDYRLMREIYRKEIGFLPRFYALMHSNTGQFGTNDKASLVNAKNIYSLFDLNINREGYSRNDKNNSVYDLTRMQPQSSWSTNHLLMRLWDDTKQEMAFTVGDAQKAAAWTMLEGKTEFDRGDVIVTSMPKGAGNLRLNGSESYGDISLTLGLEGNALGSQSVLLRADERLQSYIRVEVKDKDLIVTQVSGGKSLELFHKRLDLIIGAPLVSVPEDQKQTEIARLQMRLKYADEAEKAVDTAQQLKDAELKETQPVEAGAEEFIPNLDLNEMQSKKLAISIHGDKLSVSVDGVSAISELPVECAPQGAILLEARSSIQKYSQRNLTDDVYDGVFRDLVVTEPSGTALFDGRPEKKERVLYAITDRWNRLINWFIETL